MIQSIGGVLADIAILGIFIYIILLLNGKVKMRPDKEEKFDEIVSRRGRLINLLVYSGALIFATIILVELFSFKIPRRRAISEPYNHVGTNKHILRVDTIVIREKCAVLYSPDSVRIRKRIKEIGESDFRVGAEDYLYYMMLTNDFLNSTRIRVIQIKKTEILKFQKTNHTSKIIKVDTLPELWGAFLFEPSRDPKAVDITNIDAEYKSYFSY